MGRAQQTAEHGEHTATLPQGPQMRVRDFLSRQTHLTLQHLGRESYPLAQGPPQICPRKEPLKVVIKSNVSLLLYSKTATVIHF